MSTLYSSVSPVFKVLSLVNPRIRQRFQTPPREDVCELTQQRVVNQTIRAQGFAAVEFERRSIKSRDLAAGFFHDQHSRRRIPGIQIELPETVVAATGHVAQIQRRRSCSPHSVGMQRDLVIEINIWILMPLVAGKTRAQ